MGDPLICRSVSDDYSTLIFNIIIMSLLLFILHIIIYLILHLTRCTFLLVFRLWFLVLKHLKKPILFLLECVLCPIHGRLCTVGHLILQLLCLSLCLIIDPRCVRNWKQFSLAIFAEALELSTVAAATGGSR